MLLPHLINDGLQLAYLCLLSLLKVPMNLNLAIGLLQIAMQDVVLVGDLFILRFKVNDHTVFFLDLLLCVVKLLVRDKLA